jgi:hypothetical protein
MLVMSVTGEELRLTIIKMCVEYLNGSLEQKEREKRHLVFFCAPF